MPRRRASRFAFEVLFLIAVAAALTVAELRPAVVAGVMLLGWFVVALFEWAAWLDEPHFGSGLPPRYYVPQAALPPSRPVEQVASAYPDTDEHEDERTWIASPDAWGEVLDDWPVLDSTAVGEETEIAAPDVVADRPDEEPAAEAELTSELDLTPPQDLVLPAEEEARGEDELDVRPIASGDQPEGEEVAEPEGVLPTPSLGGVPLVARHRLDPLAVPPRGRFRRRGARGELDVIEVQARPPSTRALPGRARRDDQDANQPAEGAVPTDA